MGISETSAALAGSKVQLESGEMLFRLDAHPDNPIVTPQDLGLLWQRDGKQHIGAVFNCGAALLNESASPQVVLMPRCASGYERRLRFDRDLGIDKYYMVDYISQIWPLISDDGVAFRRLGDDVVLRGDGVDHSDFLYGYEDVRIVPYSDGYLLAGSGMIEPPFSSKNSARGAFYTTRDFRDFRYLGMIRPIATRNAVVFPSLVGDRMPMLLRIRPDMQLAMVEPRCLEQPDEYPEVWTDIQRRAHDLRLLAAGELAHEAEKIGAGPPPLETDAGWLMIYHAVGPISLSVAQAFGLSQPLSRAYSVCAALLDRDEPWRVLRRARYPLYIPTRPWELHGDDQYPIDIPAVVFPVGALVVDGRLLLYCGAGDKYITLIGCEVDALLDYLLEHAQQPETAASR